MLFHCQIYLYIIFNKIKITPFQDAPNEGLRPRRYELGMPSSFAELAPASSLAGLAMASSLEELAAGSSLAELAAQSSFERLVEESSFAKLATDSSFGPAGEGELRMLGAETLRRRVRASSMLAGSLLFGPVRWYLGKLRV